MTRTFDFSKNEVYIFFEKIESCHNFFSWTQKLNSKEI